MGKQVKFTEKERKKIENFVMKSAREGGKIKESFEQVSAILPKFNPTQIKTIFYTAIFDACRDKYEKAKEEGRKVRVIGKTKAGVAEQPVVVEDEVTDTVEQEVTITKEQVQAFGAARRSRANEMFAAFVESSMLHMQELEARNAQLEAELERLKQLDQTA